jgi:membrane-associated protein
MIAVLTPLMVALGPLALLLLMGVLFAETGLLLGFFLPGDSLLFAAGVLVAAGAMHVPLWLVALGAFAAAAAGDQVGYLLGRRFGPRIFNRLDSRVFSREHVTRAHDFFERHGPKAVVLARFVPVVRTFTPAVAGVAQMPRRYFTVFNLVGGLAWALGLTIAGYLLGGIPLISHHVELFAIGLVAISVLPGVVTFVRRRGARRPKDADTGSVGDMSDGRQEKAAATKPAQA